MLTAIWLPIVFSYEPGRGLDWDPDYLAATLLVTVLTLLRLPTLVVVVVGMGASSCCAGWGRGLFWPW